MTTVTRESQCKVKVDIELIKRQNIFSIITVFEPSNMGRALRHLCRSIYAGYSSADQRSSPRIMGNGVQREPCYSYVAS